MTVDEIARGLNQPPALIEAAIRAGLIPKNANSMQLTSLVKTNTFMSRLNQLRKKLVVDSDRQAQEEHALMNKKAELRQKIKYCTENGNYVEANSYHELLHQLEKAN